MNAPLDDATTDPNLESWIDGARGSGFPVQGLPYGVFSRPGEEPRPGVRIGDRILDLAAVARAGLLDAAVADAPGALSAPSLNPLLARGAADWKRLRGRLSSLLRADGAAELRDDAALRERALVPADGVTLHRPFEPGDYVDFYSSEAHATNLGRMFRPTSDPLLPNWKHLPVGYHGRAGTVVVSGTPIVRPSGQRKGKDDPAPSFGPSARLDVEVEVGFVTGPGVPLGERIPTSAAAEHVFGLVLVNDWSARDIQAWEYQPLGPFLGKSFATSVAPWVVPLDALAPFRVPGPAQEPAVLDYLRCDAPWGVDLRLELALETRAMRDAGAAPAVLSRPRFAEMYWNLAQQLAHATVNGATIRPGDLFASGTVSNEAPDTRGSFIELCWGGRDPITLPDGSTRTFLEDGDTAIIRGHCGGGDRPRIDFGEVSGTVAPAR